MIFGRGSPGTRLVALAEHEQSMSVMAEICSKKDVTYYLVKWLDDDQLGVIPESYFRPGANLNVGSCSQAARKYSSVKIIKISGMLPSNNLNNSALY